VVRCFFSGSLRVSLRWRKVVKTELTVALLKSLSPDRKPVGFDQKGKIIYEENAGGEPYIVFDASPGAPLGFGVKVGGRKTFIVQRKVEGKTSYFSAGFRYGEVELGCGHT